MRLRKMICARRGVEILVTGPSDSNREAASGPCGTANPREGAGDKVTTGGAAERGTQASQQPKATESSGAAKHRRKRRRSRSHAPAYGALDLGTNNCRLLVARPSRRGFFVIDAFSRIIRLGEGVTATRKLSDEAMTRTLEALKICADKMRHRRVRRARVIATEACRAAENCDEFVARVQDETGLELEIVNNETEARLAVSGCSSLIDRDCDWALVFDIGGGSSEFIWLDLREIAPGSPRDAQDQIDLQSRILAWTSLRIGVVTLAEKHGGRDVGPATFETMVDDVMRELISFEAKHGLDQKIDHANAHLMGTSGTVTTIAGIHLDLPAYDRRRVDGCWLELKDIRAVFDQLIAMSYEERVAQPCIGQDRADLVLAGCAILEAVQRLWPCERLRVADRGLREGILANLMAEDGYPQWRRPARYRPRGQSQPRPR